MLKPIFVFAVAGLILLTSACGSGGDSTSNGQASPAASPEPTGSAVALPTMSPDVPLVEYQSPNMGYSISYPEGWEARPAAPGGDAFVRMTPDGKVAAQLTVLCTPAEAGWTPATLMTIDAAAVKTVGAFQGTDPTDVQVAGVAGKERRYVAKPAGFSIEHVAAYFVNGDCGWRVGLASYGDGTLDPYVPLFDRLLQTFKLQ